MTKPKQKLVRRGMITLISLSFLVLLLLTTNPYHLPIVVLLFPFLLIFLVSYETVYLISSKLTDIEHKNKQRLGSGIIAGALVTLALLQSIRELSPRDLIIIVILVIGMSFYLLRIDF